MDESPQAAVPVCPCERCGAPLPFDDVFLSTDVACSHCGTRHELSTDVRTGVRAYVSETRRLWASALKAREGALFNRSSRRAGAFLATVVVSIWFPFILKDPSPSVVANVCVVALMWFALFAVGWTARWTFQTPSIETILGTQLGGCTACGAPVEFEEGSGTAQCRYCGASCLVNEDIKEQMEALARKRLNIAEGKRERTAQALRRDLDRLAWVVLIVGMSALPLVGFFYEAIQERWPTPGPTHWILPSMLLGFVLLLVWGAAGIKTRIARQQAFDQVVASLRN